jgi:hypothetical protein
MPDESSPQQELFDEQSAHCCTNGFGRHGVLAPRASFIGLTRLAILLF